MTDAPASPVSPRRRFLRLRDGEISALEFGDPARPLDAIFSHANGFNALTYRSILQPLAGEMRILAIDLRGHGESRLPADPRAFRRSWAVMRRDLVEVLDQEAQAPVVLAGHSMGAIVSLLAAERRPERVGSVLMFEPVILPFLGALYARLPWVSGVAWKNLPMAIAARKRRSNFDRAELALASYRGRGAFKTWPDQALADYVEGGLRATSDGGFELACDPEWEAANYAAQANDSWGAIRRLRRPMTILRAEKQSSCFAAPSELMRRNPLLQVVSVPGTTHFLPMERPEVVQAALREAVGA